MALRGIPFPLRSNPAPFKFMGEPRLRNVFPEEIGRENRRPVAFLSIPGWQGFAEVAESPSRGAIEVADLDCYFSLHGYRLYRIDQAGDATQIPGLIPGSQPVVMEHGPRRFMSSEVTISIASPAVVTWTNHRLAANTPIRFLTDGELPDGIDTETTYYIRATGLTASSFQISTSEGGGAVNTTGGQFGVHTAVRTEPTVQVMVVSDLAVFCVENDNIYFVETPEPINSVTYLDQRFVLTSPSGRYYWTPVNDGRTIDPLAFANAEARPDGLVRGFADGGELWLFGTKTTEIHTGTADAAAPFQPLGGAFVDKGCLARDTVVSLDNAVHWVGHDCRVYRASGYEAMGVSTPAVDRAIERLPDAAKAAILAYSYVKDGHTFYVLTTAEWTWVYDAATRQWHERNSYQRPDWRAWPYVNAFGKHLVGDKESGSFFELVDNHTEDGRPIRRELILPDVPGRMFFHAIELHCATGVGLAVLPGQAGHDPLLMLTWSDDGGHIWSSERLLPMGAQGQYGRLVKETGLGVSEHQGRRFKIAVSEPTITAFLLVDIDAEPWA